MGRLLAANLVLTRGSELFAFDNYAFGVYVLTLVRKFDFFLTRKSSIAYNRGTLIHLIAV